MALTSKMAAAAIAVATSLTGVAASAQSIDVRVIGTITPAACTPNISGGGVIDYGNIPAATLSPTSFTVLPEQEVPISITCDAPTKVAVRAVDNRAASRVANITDVINPAITNDGNFGLGTVSGADVGGYVMRMKQGTFTMDGAPGFTVLSKDVGASWEGSGEGVVYHASTHRNSWSRTQDSPPTAFTNLAGTFSVEAVLNKGDALPLTDEVPLDGLATIELLYI
ncbi:DUF1120 domain-containing protein [Sphingopyxis sp. MWB1]|uniref:DUF1120 domain-containing protein n=1 Tax=Sphingopyxis sp. MWB1 TaxID=1537715 RepID=UPI000A6D0758|nr:DUF1120 domain-containing protein [Sphingopyxis sp. MWB1]